MTEPLCPACSKAFASPDWDPFCSSCVEAGWRDAYLRGQASALPDLCRLSYELGLAQGKLASLGTPVPEPRNEGHKPGTEGRE